MNSRSPLILIGFWCLFRGMTAAQETPPYAIPTDQPGVVISPFKEGRKLDVTGLAPGSLVRDPVAGKVFRIPETTEGAEEIPPAPSPPPGGNTFPGISGENRVKPAMRPPSGTLSSPADLPEPAEEPGIPPGPTLPPDLHRFIAAFNEASSVNEADALAPFYADPVERYFGKQDRSYDWIRGEREAHIRRYPERKYTLAGVPKLLWTDGTTYDIAVTVNYSTRGGGGIRNGSVSDFLKIRRSPRGYRIVCIEEIKGKIPPDWLGGRGGETVTAVPGRFPEVVRFIEDFHASGRLNEASACVKFMHSRVERYFGQRNPSRSALLRDRENYIRRWPSRNYWLVEPPQVSRRSDGTFDVISRIGYEVRNGSKRASGVATSVVRVVETPEGFRIVSIYEK